MTQFVTFLMVVLNIYMPINAWISHDNGIATPLSYIGLGFSMYFWLLVLVNFLTPKEQRKIYSQEDLELAIYEALPKTFNEETKH